MSETIRIQCPECSQSFNVSDDFVGKTVECGACDYQFKITDDVVLREKKKFYPGEKEDAHLEVFSNANSAGAAEPVEFQTAQYQSNVDAGQVGPVRPRKTIAAVIGIMALLIGLAAFAAAAKGVGAVAEMGSVERFVLAGFICILGGWLALYGMARHKAKAGILVLVMAGMILALAAMVKDEKINEVADTPPSTSPEKPKSNLLGRSPEEQYRFDIGYDPVESRIEKHGKERVIAVFVRNVTRQTREHIRDYLHQQIGETSDGISYPRGDDETEGLIVFSLTDKQPDEVAAMCKKFGRVKKIDRDLRVVDVLVVASKIVDTNPTKATDPKSNDYEHQNYKALESIDPVELMNTVKRLAESEPKAMRSDMSRRLISMLPDSRDDLKLELIRAVARWSQPGEGAEEAVLDAVKKLGAKGKPSKPGVLFLVDRKVDDVGPILMEFWKKDPVGWSDVMLKIGDGAQFLLLPQLKELDTPHAVAASEILGKVGKKDAIPHMQEAITAQKDAAAKKSLQAAIDEIKSRN